MRGRNVHGGLSKKKSGSSIKYENVVKIRVFRLFLKTALTILAKMLQNAKILEDFFKKSQVRNSHYLFVIAFSPKYLYSEINLAILPSLHRQGWDRILSQSTFNSTNIVDRMLSHPFSTRHLSAFREKPLLGLASSPHVTSTVSLSV